MKRDIDRLAQTQFDVLVIGGGIYGAAIGLETSRLGMKTALIEQKDFSHATSANSLKILHGGFRYLRHLDLRRARASAKSRNELIRIAPHLIEPKGFVIPTYGYGMRNPHIMRVAIFVNDLIGCENKKGLENGYMFPRGRILSIEELNNITLDDFKQEFSGAALWYEALAKDTERLTLTLIKKAYANGACIANYLKANEVMAQSGRVLGVCATDLLSNAELQISASIIVNAAGPWIAKVLQSCSQIKNRTLTWAKGLNIIVKKSLINGYGLALEGANRDLFFDSSSKKGKRFFFFIPRGKHTMIGTAYKLCDDDPDKFCVDRRDIEEFIGEVNKIYPPAELAFEDVSFFHGGLLPVVRDGTNKASGMRLEERTHIFDHGKLDGISGLFSVKSVKYATAPGVAKKVVKCIGLSNGAIAQRRKGNTRTIEPMFVSASMPELQEGSDANGSTAMINHLKSVYGPQYTNVMKYLANEFSLYSWINEDPPLLAAEVLHCIREEMALKLSDIVLRRTGIGTVECPSIQTLNSITDIMAHELGWDLTRKAEEIKEVLRCYHPLSTTKNLP